MALNRTKCPFSIQRSDSIRNIETIEGNTASLSSDTPSSSARIADGRVAPELLPVNSRGRRH